jgi:conjugal transfer mating pair stabilization protein TraG
MDQVERIGLTPSQTAVYRNALGTVLPEATGLHERAQSDLAQARETLVREEGSVGEHIADLLVRSAGSRDDSDLRLIAAFNRANGGGAPLSPPLTHASVTGGPGGAVLDLIAAAESSGNYNAWYGDADQSRVNLSVLTVDDVRELQQDLVRSNGGSAIGRYQIIDDTLERLVGTMGLTGGERFTPALQDRMALRLVREAGLQDWQSGGISDEHFAYNLSQIWAGLPRDASNLSFHEGVAGNRAQIDHDDVLTSLRTIRSAPSS